MIFQGEAFSVELGGDNIAELKFDLQGESVNKFNKTAIVDLQKAMAAIKADENIKGLVITSGKSEYIVGADITEFGDMFAGPSENLIADILQTNEIFSSLEDLPIPSVAAINGTCLGGGFEFVLAADYRVLSERALVGFPEVKLGLIPGFGGTVRTSRLLGADNAIEWIATGKNQKSSAALKVGAADAVVAEEAIVETARSMVKDAIDGKLDFMARKSEKKGPLKLNAIESMMAFETAKGYIASTAGPHYPAPVEAVKAIQKHATMDREKALAIEATSFAKLAKTPASKNLIGLFLNDQQLKKDAKFWEKQAKPVNKAAVLGAGIMGGGIAYQSASKGTPIIMKDINEEGISLGLNEAAKLTSKMVDSGRMKPMKMAQILNDIRPTLNFGDFGGVDVVVEAVVENEKVKKMVLAETETHLSDTAVLTSNTSTISITSLATAVKRPEQFCGMHFFNPVHRMPLVEVIRGEKTSDETVATVVAYAKKLGKSPIVVNDCPGFLVNRVLFPYFGGFSHLVKDGVDFKKIDKVMEKFGWPMGPAYLLDVVGIDTAVHAQEVMAEGFPDRMKQDYVSSIQILFDNKRFGQKNNLGFYQYELDKKGKPKKVVDDTVYELIKPVQSGAAELSDDDILARMMIPLCLETVRCLEDGIVSKASDADMGLIYGIGFPPFRGGALNYIDDMGVAEFVALADKYADLGALYQVTDKLREMAKSGTKFFG